VEAAGVAGEGVPGAVRQGAIEGDADASAASVGLKLCGDDACVVGDKQVARLEQVWQVRDGFVLQRVCDVQEFCRVFRMCRLLSDAFVRQVEVETVGQQIMLGS
jgi:hypothetical protein